MDAGVDQGAANSRARPRRALTLLWPYPGRQLGAGFNPLAFKGAEHIPPQRCSLRQWIQLDLYEGGARLTNAIIYQARLLIVSGGGTTGRLFQGSQSLQGV